MPAKIRWNGDQAKNLIAAEFGRRLDVCRVIVADHAKVLVGVEGTAVRQATTTGRGGKKKRKGSLIYNADPSLPGQPPHKQTGQLQSSIASEREGLVARVGSGLRTARWLELGTATMPARPWLRRALLEMTGRIRAVLSRPIR